MMRRMRSICPVRPGSAARATAIVLALVLMSWLVLDRSESAFTATTVNDGNRLAASSIELTDNDSGSAMFNVGAMRPGQTETSCIEITYRSEAAAGESIRWYVDYADSPHDANTTADSDLAPYVDLTVEAGATGSTCTNFAAAKTHNGTIAHTATDHKDYATGEPWDWIPGASEAVTRAMRMTATLRDDNAAQGKSVEPVFTWEVRS